jgi:hypothetical protein
MMEYMSSFPPPNFDQAVTIIADHLETTLTNEKVDRELLEQIIGIEIKSYGGVANFGSYSGWQYFAFKELVENTKLHLSTIIKINKLID